MDASPCFKEHTIHRDPDVSDVERFWVTCGDDVLAEMTLEMTFPRSRMDRSDEIRYFMQRTMNDHERAAWIAQNERLRRALVEILDQDPPHVIEQIAHQAVHGSR